MLKHFLIFITISFLNYNLLAQCPTGDVTLSSQTEVDNFLTTYPNCTEMAGRLHIFNNDATPYITDLSPLSNLTSIGGELSITNNDHLTNLEGLNTLTSIGGQLFIGINKSLKNYEGLNALTSIGRDFTAILNDSLTNFEGLDALTLVGENLFISLNENLASFEGLENTSFIDITSVNISNNPQLSNCAIESICTFLDIEMSIATITNNGVGCNDRMEVEMACNSIIDGDLCGNAFDINNLFDQGINQPQTSSLYNNTNNSATGTPDNGFECHYMNDAISNSLWMNFTGDGNSYRMTTTQCSASAITYLYDNQMALYSGECWNLMPVSCNEDQDVAQEIFNAELIFETEAGVNYFLMMDGYGQDTGEFCLEVTQMTSVDVTDIATTDIKVFPNPTNGRLQFHNITVESAVIFNPQGQRLMHYDTPINELDISMLPTGVYYLSLHTGSNEYSARIVKID